MSQDIVRSVVRKPCRENTSGLELDRSSVENRTRVVFGVVGVDLADGQQV